MKLARKTLLAALTPIGALLAALAGAPTEPASQTLVAWLAGLLSTV